MQLIHQMGSVRLTLNPKKGIWCEFCGKDCMQENLLLIEGYNKPRVYEPICIQCAQDLITCLQRTLTDVLLLGDKENV